MIDVYTADARVIEERRQWLELTKDLRCCGELLRVALSANEGKLFFCKNCGATWKKR